MTRQKFLKSTTTAFVVLLCLALQSKGSTRASSPENKEHPSVLAAMQCIDQIAPIVQSRDKSGNDVACDLPVSLSENDLDEIFKAAARSSKMSEKMRERAEKYSPGIAKALTNFRGARCLIKLRIKRADIVDALSLEDKVWQMPDQPAECDVTTRKYEIRKLRFAFSPRIEMKNGCVEEFALNMGKIDAGCRVCYFDRLYLSTRLVSLWANQMSGNVKRAINAQLENSCKASRP